VARSKRCQRTVCQSASSRASAAYISRRSATMKRSVCCQPRRAPKAGVGFMGQKKRGYSSSSVAGGSWGSLSIKSAPCLLLAGRERRHAPRCGRSLNITSKAFPQRLTILLGLKACCVRRSRNALAGRHQIAPCWIFWRPKAPGLPAHSPVRAQARLCKNEITCDKGSPALNHMIRFERADDVLIQFDLNRCVADAETLV
jgi:hypothetical protein